MASRFDSGPYQGVLAITANGVTLTKPVRAIMCTVAGNVNLNMADGTTAVVPISANTIYPFMVLSIAAASTTATGIIGFY